LIPQSLEVFAPQGKLYWRLQTRALVSGDSVTNLISGCDAAVPRYTISTAAGN